MARCKCPVRSTVISIKTRPRMRQLARNLHQRNGSTSIVTKAAACRPPTRCASIRDRYSARSRSRQRVRREAVRVARRGLATIIRAKILGLGL
jgi:hypothetical protein